MNHAYVALQLAELIVDITDPKITRWEKEQREINARVKARDYLKKLKEAS